MQENNKRIAKNTMMLYFRMMLTMLVSLYTVRVVLKTLGEIDYGIYNVVGGIVMMFSFLSSTMASASQRFFAFEIGRKNYEQLKKTFGTTITIYVLIAILILILAETLGLWFLNTQMTIPVKRIAAANWVFQFSVLSFMMTIITIPYNAAIIAHEKMNVYAYVSIIDVFLKLLIVYLLVMFSFDKLVLYAVLTFCVTTVITLIYRTYCKRKFEECRFAICWDKPLFMEIVSYSGWNMIGATANVLKEQGINILLNIFFNPAINAARAVAHQINTALLSFTNNFYTAVRPQIVKSYVADGHKNMAQLVFKSAKFGFYLMMLLTTPILLDTHYVLSIWLDNIPDYAVIFTKLVLINILIDAMNLPFVNAIQATGKIKVYQTSVTLLFFLNLPVTFLLLQLGYPPQSAMYVSIGVSLSCYIPRLIIFYKTTEISCAFFLKHTLPIVLIVYFITILPSLCLMHNLTEGILRFISVSVLSVFWGILMVYIVGLNKSEKILVNTQISKFTKWKLKEKLKN